MAALIKLPREETLTWYEMEEVCRNALSREIESYKKGSKPRFKANTVVEDLVINVDASGAEMVVAKLLDKFWMAGVNRWAEHDVSTQLNVEVRHSTCANGHLVVYQKDIPERPYVLVTGTMPTYTVRGWKWGYEAKLAKWQNHRYEDKPFWVPQSELYRDNIGEDLLRHYEPPQPVGDDSIVTVQFLRGAWVQVVFRGSLFTLDAPERQVLADLTKVLHDYNARQCSSLAHRNGAL